MLELEAVCDINLLAVMESAVRRHSLAALLGQAIGEPLLAPQSLQLEG